MSPTQTPIPMTLTAYQNIAFTNIQWQPTLSGSGSLTISDATNNGDITGGTFVGFSGTGTAVMYLEFTATTTLSFPATPTVTLTDTSPFPGAGTCAFFGYINNGNAAYSWQQVNTSFTASTGSGPYTVSLPSVTAAQVGGQINFQASPFYGAIVCK
jgi:hypothetical protein